MKNIQARIIEYLELQGVTQENFAKDEVHGSAFDKGRLGKKTGRLGIDVVEKFLRRFPEVSPRWIILGEGNMVESVDGKKIISDSQTYKMFLDYKEVQRNYEQSLKDLVNEKERMINEKERMINEKERTITLLLEAKNSTKQTASV